MAPRHGLELTTEVISDAKRSLVINIYEMKSKAVVDAIIQQIENGVSVQILQEGEPVGGLKAAEKKQLQRIVKAMQARGGSHHYYLMTSQAERVGRRYRFDHAKYVIIDDKALFIGSENFSENPQASRLGNRGWQVLLEDPKLAREFKTVFQKDSVGSDIVDLTQERRRHREALPEVEEIFPLPVFPAEAFEPVISIPANQDISVSSAEAIFSPHSLSGLEKLIGGAKRSLRLELMTFASQWSGRASPLVAAVEKAAGRGVKVEVLLNDESVFSKPGGQQMALEDESAADLEWLASPPRRPRTRSGPRPRPRAQSRRGGNADTCDELNALASRSRVDIECRIADVKAMKVAYIHNKGALVDGRRVLISSINWNQNSVQNNREAGVVLNSEEAYRFYDGVFQQDWDVSESGRRN